MGDSRAFDRLMDKYDYSCGSLITPEGSLFISDIITTENSISFQFCTYSALHKFYKALFPIITNQSSDIYSKCQNFNCIYYLKHFAFIVCHNFCKLGPFYCVVFSLSWCLHLSLHF